MPEEHDREWLVQDWNFDNLGNAMLTLFTSSTGEGWPNVMQAAIDAVDLDHGPQYNNQPRMALYFIFFVVIMSFFFLNIFVALIILTFQEEASKEDKDCELDRNERNCLEFAMRAQPIQIFVPVDVKSIQYKVFGIIGTKWFDTFIMSLIIGNTVVLLIGYFDAPEILDDIIGQASSIFNYFFTMELILKLLAFGFDYFKDGWNSFDFIIVAGSWGDFIIQTTFTDAQKEQLPFDTSMLRLFRAARLVKLLNRSKTIKVLMFTFVQSFKALPYVGALIFLLFFIYSILGMHLFSHIDINQSDEPWDQINRNNHFRTFFGAFQVLFRCATGENWPNIMYACTSPAKCDPNIKTKEPRAPDETCGSDIAWFYFISFIFNCSFLMLNLFVAVIMDNFAFLSQDESILGPHHLDDFLIAWSEYDPRGRGYLRHAEICQLLRQLSPPLGLGAKCPKNVIYKKLIRMNMLMRLEDGCVNFNATLFHLVRTALNICTEQNNLRRNDNEIRSLLRRVWPNIMKHTVFFLIPKRTPEQRRKTLAKLYVGKLLYEKYKYMRKEATLRRKKSMATGALTEDTAAEERKRKVGISDPKEKVASALSTMTSAATAIAGAATAATTTATTEKVEEKVEVGKTNLGAATTDEDWC